MSILLQGAQPSDQIFASLEVDLYILVISVYFRVYDHTNVLGEAAFGRASHML